MAFQCIECRTNFGRKDHYYRHMRTKHQIDVVKEKKKEKRAKKAELTTSARSFNFTKDINNDMFICPRCFIPFISKNERDIHYKNHAKEKVFNCNICFKSFSNKTAMRLHERFHNLEDIQKGGNQVENDLVEQDYSGEDDAEFIPREIALDGIVRMERLNFSENGKDLLDRLKTSLELAHDKLVFEQEKSKPFKFYLALKATFYKASNSAEITTPPPCFNSEPIVILPPTNVKEVVEKVYSNLMKQMENYSKNGSGWVLKNFVTLEINFLSYKPLRGSSFIETPKNLQNKKGFINIKNNDQKCFLWSVLAHLHSANENKNQVSNYQPYENELNMQGISYPVSIKDIDKIEAQNASISINIYGLDGVDIFPLRISSLIREKHIRLLLISNKTNMHYICITNLSSMVGTQINAHKGSKYICDRCINTFQSEMVLEKHFEICSESNPVREFYPQNEVKKFTKVEYQLECPFFIVADFETLQEPIDT